MEGGTDLHENDKGWGVSEELLDSEGTPRVTGLESIFRLKLSRRRKKDGGKTVRTFVNLRKKSSYREFCNHAKLGTFQGNKRRYRTLISRKSACVLSATLESLFTCSLVSAI